MVISVGEDLFLLVLTWRWDDWGRQPCYIFSGHPQRGLYTKDCQEAWAGGEEHSPRGVVSDSDKPEGSLVLLRRRWRGARPGPVLPQAGTEGPAPAGCTPPPLPRPATARGLGAPSPVPRGNPRPLHGSPCPGHSEWTHVPQSSATSEEFIFLHLGEKKPETSRYERNVSEGGYGLINPFFSLFILIIIIIISIILPLNCRRMLSKTKSFISGESSPALFISCNKMYVMIMINVCLLLYHCVCLPVSV